MKVSQLIAKSYWKKLSNKEKVALNKVNGSAQNSPYLNDNIAYFIRASYFYEDIKTPPKDLEEIIQDAVWTFRKGDPEKIKEILTK